MEEELLASITKIENEIEKLLQQEREKSLKFLEEKKKEIEQELNLEKTLFISKKEKFFEEEMLKATEDAKKMISVMEDRVKKIENFNEKEVVNYLRKIMKKAIAQI